MAKKKFKKATSDSKHSKIDYSHKKAKPDTSIISKPAPTQRTTRSATQAANADVKAKQSAEPSKDQKEFKDVDSDSNTNNNMTQKQAPSKPAAINESDYKKMQDTHIQSLERELKYSNNK